MTSLKRRKCCLKFNPSSYAETCLPVSAFILTSFALKLSIWMLKLSVHWVVYKARLHEKHRVQDEVYKYIMS